MENTKYMLCQNCSVIHYAVDKEEFLSLEKISLVVFSKRNLRHCFGCGKKDKFIEISEQEIDSYLSGSDIPALYIE